MTLPRLLRAALVGAVGACVALSGCTSDEPTPAPSTSASATDAPTQEPTDEPTVVVAPEKPTLMDSNDAIGARAAAEYFLSLHGYVLETGDLDQWDELCHPESAFCESVRESVRTDAEAGLTYRGGEVTTTVERVTEPSSAVEFFEVAGELAQGPSETLDSSGAVVDARIEVIKADFTVLLRMDPSGVWLIRAVSIGDPK